VLVADGHLHSACCFHAAHAAPTHSKQQVQRTDVAHQFWQTTAPARSSPLSYPTKPGGVMGAVVHELRICTKLLCMACKAYSCPGAPPLDLNPSYIHAAVISASSLRRHGAAIPAAPAVTTTTTLVKGCYCSLWCPWANGRRHAGILGACCCWPSCHSCSRHCFRGGCVCCWAAAPCRSAALAAEAGAGAWSRWASIFCSRPGLLVTREVN
jgi:hypothetical protein